MAYDAARGVTVLFGGYNGGATYNGETWDWNGTTWTQRLVSGPSPRYGHAMAYDAARGVTILFGGGTSTVTSGETWLLRTSCYANCDGSTTAPILNATDFMCFLNRFRTGDPYANCDHSTAPPVVNVIDFACFLNQFAAGCS